MTPPIVYVFIAADGKLVAVTGDRAEANGWMAHRKVGDVVAGYKLEREERKEKGK